LRQSLTLRQDNTPITRLLTPPSGFGRKERLRRLNISAVLYGGAVFEEIMKAAVQVKPAAPANANRLNGPFVLPEGVKEMTLYWAKMHPDDIITGGLIRHERYLAEMYLDEGMHAWMIIVNGIIKERCESTVPASIARIESELETAIQNYQPRTRDLLHQ
jgi:hypothetical protein